MGLRRNWGLLVCAVMLAGCAGYRLGPTNGVVARSKSVRVHLFENATQEPRLKEAVGQSLRRQIQQDGTFTLETQEDPDIEVTGKIVKYTRSGVSYQPNDVLTVRDFILTMEAQVKAVERVSGNVLMDRTVIGHTSVRYGTDLSSAEFQAVPLLAEDLGRRVTSYLVDGSW